MCLILFSYDNHPRYRLVLIANRDEFYDRPTAAANFWEDDNGILAGIDLKEGGTWLGLTRWGRFAAITNYRDPSTRKEQAISRGLLVSEYLRTDVEAEKYIEKIKTDIDHYNDFNLLIGDTQNLYYLSSKPTSSLVLQPGTYGLSNHLLDTPWPKIKSGKNALNDKLSGKTDFSIEQLFEILKDETQPEDENLPETGVGLEWERMLAPIFIKSQTYGTRSSTILLIDQSNNVTFVERTYNQSDQSLTEDRIFELNMS